MSRPGVLTGAGVALLLTAPLIVVSALGNQLAGLPFIPYDLFPFIRDLTPGPVLTFVIDTMSATIRTLDLGRVDEAAKTAEQAMTILMLIALGMVAGAAFFAFRRASGGRGSGLTGLLFGLLVGLVLALISHNLGLSAQTDAPLLNALWTLLLFAIWGLLHGWAYDRLASLPADAPARTLTAG